MMMLDARPTRINLKNGIDLFAFAFAPKDNCLVNPNHLRMETMGDFPGIKFLNIRVDAELLALELSRRERLECRRVPLMKMAHGIP